ncbi:MAG TPA: methyltransferase domain-containing protein [Anaerolineae bacterium]|nr:methyltransferase domain-containing protein [Anaerolineae bacterium]
MKISKIVDNSDQTSYAAKLRRKRFSLFLELLADVPKPVKILDIGGTQRFWEVMGFINQPDVHITLLNLDRQEVNYDNFSTVIGDATNLAGIKDQEFDAVFSNSVIEHVGDYQQQKQMAQEVQRVGRRYFVQTPNYFFPIEPHFLFLGFQWLPIPTRTWLLQHFNLGWIPRIPEVEEAKRVVESIRLLRKKEFVALFPGATIYEEKFFGLTKSFIAYRGWCSR